MKTFNIVPNIPPELEPLKEISYNLWHVWNPDAITLFMRIDRKLWESCNHNPVLMLGRLSQEKLNELVHDEGFMLFLEKVYSDFRRYVDNKNFFQYSLGVNNDFKIAYFSAEFGINDSIPNYSGGLGVLAGDHLKSSSDLNIPLIGIGLMYQQGYFRQYLTPDGWQQETYPENDFHNMPMKLVKNGDGNPLTVSVKVGDRNVYVRVWKLKVGRVSVYMLDTNNQMNSEEDRKITDQLYGGDIEHRIQQEIILGIGGVRVLDALGIKPAVFHLNEGHSAFATFERIRLLVEKHGLTFEEARLFVQHTTVFTTHTPVPAGNDVFPPDLIYRYFSVYISELGLSQEQFLSFGRVNPFDTNEGFCMTVLALKNSAFANGVSKLHGKVSRNMWKGLFPHIDVEEVPIKYITNGVHIPSWISLDLATLYSRYLGPQWSEDPDNEKIWERALDIPDEELWRTHERRRERLVAFVRRRLVKCLKKKGARQSEIMKAKQVLDPEALTIGFARRFATYKRAYLIFKDPDRLDKILNNQGRPVQIIIAGKAHPKDMAGKEIIKKIVQIAREERFRKKVVFLEDYDINIARYLVQGVDLWLNNPRRPLEASGTSGMKASANAGLNLSVLDGWWDEAYNGENGWAIGSGEEYEDVDYQDDIESRAIYDLLEKEIVPLFYARQDDKLPVEWIERMKINLKTICGFFNTHRMVEDYMEKFYLKGANHFFNLGENNFEGLKNLLKWKRKVDSGWYSVNILESEFLGDRESPIKTPLGCKVRVDLAGLNPEDVIVEAYFGKLDANGNMLDFETVKLENVVNIENTVYEFSGEIVVDKTGRFGIRFRVRPVNINLEESLTLTYIKWDD